MTRFLLVGSLMLFACKGKLEEPASEEKRTREQQESPQHPSCEKRATRLSDRLAALEATGKLMVGFSSAVKLIASSYGKSIDIGGTWVAITAAGEISLSGKNNTDLEREIHSMKVDAEMRGDGSAIGPVYLAADTAASARLLLEVAAKFRAQNIETRLMTAGPEVVDRGYDSELRAVPSVQSYLAGSPSAEQVSDRAGYLATQLELAIGVNCSPLVKVFSDIAGAPATQKSALLATEMPKGLQTCQCNLPDLDLFEFVMLEIFGAWERRHRWIALPVGTARKGQTVAEFVSAGR